jgi:hypothetical protein
VFGQAAEKYFLLFGKLGPVVSNSKKNNQEANSYQSNEKSNASETPLMVTFFIRLYYSKFYCLHLDQSRLLKAFLVGD